MTEEPETIEEFLEIQAQQIEPIVLECLREIFHHIPKGHQFILSNGKTAQFKTFFEPRAHINNVNQSPGFGLDVCIDDFPVDHIEFTMSVSGHGGPHPKDLNP